MRVAAMATAAVVTVRRRQTQRVSMATYDGTTDVAAVDDHDTLRKVIKVQAFLDEGSDEAGYSSSNSPSLGGGGPANSRRPIGRRRKPPMVP